MKLTNLAVLTALCFSIGLVGDAESVTTSVTGTVVSSTSDRVVLNTPSGEMTFKFTPLIDRPSEMAMGSRVTVWYDPAETGVDDVAKASRIVSASSPSTIEERSGMTSAEERSGGTTSSSEEVERTSASDPDELPATAGPLPLLAWISILAVGGGFALRGLAKRHGR